MAATTTSKRAVFRTIADHSDYHWPYYRLPDTVLTAAALEILAVGLLSGLPLPGVEDSSDRCNV